MDKRLYTLLARTAYTADKTEVIDLDVKAPLSALIILLEGINSQATMTAHPVAMLTKVEIVDGSEVIHSLDGYELEAINRYDRMMKAPANYNYYLNGGTFQRTLVINFGRMLWDMELGFKPENFNNPQLRITLSYAGGGNAPSTAYLTVYAAMFDKLLPSFKGYLMSKEIKKYTMASSTHEYTDLPTDYEYSDIFFRAALAGTEPNQCITNIKLSEDRDSGIPFDHAAQEIERTINEVYGDMTEHVYFATATSKRYIYCTPTTRVAGWAEIWAAAGAAGTPAIYNGDGGRLDIIDGTAGANSQVLIKGHIPHSVYRLPVADLKDMTSYYNPTGFRSLRLDVTGAAASTGYIFARQYKPY
jgi:hypothetical protein